MKKVFSLSFVVLLFLSIFFINSESVYAANVWNSSGGYGGSDEPFSMFFSVSGTHKNAGDGYVGFNYLFNTVVSDNTAPVYIYPCVYQSGNQFGLYFVAMSESVFKFQLNYDYSGIKDDCTSYPSSSTGNPISGYYYSNYGVYARLLGLSSSRTDLVLEPLYNYLSFSTSPSIEDVLNIITSDDWSNLVINESLSLSDFEFSAALGSLQDITYKQLYEKTATGHDVYYKFDWNTRTSSGVDLTQDNYDVIYYWECSADAVSLFGNKSTIDSIYSDKFLCKLKQDGKVYSIIENSAEGDFATIFNEVIDQQPLVCRSFNVKSTLHIAPIFYDGEAYQIGYWSHLTFDNLANSEPIQDLIQDEVDGNGIEVNYDVTSDDPSISSSTGSSTIGVGSTIDEAEHNSNAGTSSSVNLDETSTNVTEAIGKFVGAIKSFVNLVSVTFSFLPDWVLAFVSLSVIIFCIMIVKRAIL